MSTIKINPSSIQRYLFAATPYLHTPLTSINAGLSSLKLLEPKQMTRTCGNAAWRFTKITVNCRHCSPLQA